MMAASLKRPYSNLVRELRERIIAGLGYVLLRGIYLTLRWEREPLIKAESWLKQNNPRIIVFWHAQQLMMGQLFQTVNRKCKAVERIYVLISQHSDGRLIARAIRHFGLDSVAGSSTRGGRRAVQELVDHLKSGDSIAITPDGPRGPRQQLKPGAVRIAQLSGRPIYPVAYAAERAWRFNSWDRMFLPKPFSRAVLKLGDPIYVPAAVSEEELVEYSRRVEESLNLLTESAEHHDYR